jgi:hypothetical protein
VELLQRIVAAVLGILLFVAAFVFASFLLAAVAAFALVIWAWLWWRTRKLRRDLAQGEQVIIDGNYRIEREVQGERVDEPPQRAGPDQGPRQGPGS